MSSQDLSLYVTYRLSPSSLAVSGLSHSSQLFSLLLPPILDPVFLYLMYILYHFNPSDIWLSSYYVCLSVCPSCSRYSPLQDFKTVQNIDWFPRNVSVISFQSLAFWELTSKSLSLTDWIAREWWLIEKSFLILVTYWTFKLWYFDPVKIVRSIE